MRTHKIWIFFFLSAFIETTNAEPEEQFDLAGVRCRNETISTNTTYHDNILTLLKNLQSLSTNEKFSTASVGLSPDRVNGLFLCRPDVSQADCEACIKTTIDTYHRYCFEGKQGAIWFEECMLQYTNHSIFAADNTQPLYENYANFKVSDPDRFPEVVNDTMRKLISEAVSPDNTQPFYAIGEADFTLLEGFYGLVLCRPDITAEECEDCLITALEWVPKCCNEGLAQWTMVLNPNCQLRFDTAPFIFPTQT